MIRFPFAAALALFAPACALLPAPSPAGAPFADPGIYVTPAERRPGEKARGVLVSAFYFDPKSLRAVSDGKVIRTFFEYHADKPVVAGSRAPEGLVAWAVVNVPAQPPGEWVIEGRGEPRGGGAGFTYLRWYKVATP